MMMLYLHCPERLHCVMLYQSSTGTILPLPLLCLRIAVLLRMYIMYYITVAVVLLRTRVSIYIANLCYVTRTKWAQGATVNVYQERATARNKYCGGKRFTCTLAVVSAVPLCHNRWDRVPLIGLNCPLDES
jgi:hypothetical protein